jgi:hypothetical protein
MMGSNSMRAPALMAEPTPTSGPLAAGPGSEASRVGVGDIEIFVIATAHERAGIVPAGSGLA